MSVTITDSVTDSLYDVDHELCYGDSYNYSKPLLSFFLFYSLLLTYCRLGTRPKLKVAGVSP
jgi:hypothetical protein